MAVQIQDRKKKSWIFDTLYIQIKSPDLETLGAIIGLKTSLQLTCSLVLIHRITL